jgi:hypothetical protein
MDLVGTVDLYWIPLGAGDHVVKASGKAYEKLSAMVHRRAPCDLYHSALVVSLPEGQYVIEQAPVPDRNGQSGRGVVAQGPVGVRTAGRFRLFRYEVRCWRDGCLPDIKKAVASPVRLIEDADEARRILELLPSVPTPTWGRDELETGEMWNSNSVTAWVLAQSGVDMTDLNPPTGGRVPGWNAGIREADRQSERPLLHKCWHGQPCVVSGCGTGGGLSRLLDPLDRRRLCK